MGSLASVAAPVLQGVGSMATMYGANMKAQGQIQAATGEAQAALFNSEIATANAGIATQNATMVGQAGDAQAGISEQQTRAQVGAIKVNQAAAGVDVNSGSAVDVRNSASGVGMLNALTIRSNAAKQAYGFQTQAASDTAQSKLDVAQAGNDIKAGNVAAKGTILGAEGASVSNFGNYLLQNSLNSSGGGNNINWEPSVNTSDIAWDK